MEFDSQKESAEYFGVSQAMMSAIFSGKKPPTNVMLRRCGYEKVVTKKVEYHKAHHPDLDQPKDYEESEND